MKAWVADDLCSDLVTKYAVHSVLGAVRRQEMKLRSEELRSDKAFTGKLHVIDELTECPGSRENLDTIVAELRCVRSSSPTVVFDLLAGRNRDQSSAAKLISEILVVSHAFIHAHLVSQLDEIRDYNRANGLESLAVITGLDPANGHPVPVGLSDSLIHSLSVEYHRDAGRNLRRFLAAIFKRWRDHDRPGSSWRLKSVVNYLDPSKSDKEILGELRRPYQRGGDRKPRRGALILGHLTEAQRKSEIAKINNARGRELKKYLAGS